MLKQGQSGRFEEIDVLRGIAALAVVVFHYSGHCVRYFGGFPFYFTYGQHGVQLFFLVSGFVIYFTLEKSRTWREFAFSRFSRLYPVYWGALTLVVAINVVVFDGPMWWGGYIVNMTMLQEFLGYPDYDQVFWSLAVELPFYVVMGALFVTGLIPRFTLVALAWLGLAALWTLAARYLGLRVPEFIPALLILPHVPYFIGGIMFYLISSRGRNSTYVGIICACVGTEWLMHGTERLVIAIVLFGAFALAISGRLRFFVSPVTLWLGAISYPLYLVHRNTGYLVLFKLDALGIPSTASFVITLAGALLLASVLTYALERPAMRALRRWYRTRPKAPSSAAL